MKVAAIVLLALVGLTAVNISYAAVTEVTTYNSDAGKLADAFLFAHNEARAAHGAAPLTWNADLAAGAVEWATKRMNGEVTLHDPTNHDNNRGENIYTANASFDFTPAPANAVWKWYDELTTPGHNFDGGYTSGTGHFTQVVWKGSTQLGCGIVMNGNTAATIVCRYSPAGNINGHFADNVEQATVDPIQYRDLDKECFDHSPNCPSYGNYCTGDLGPLIQGHCPMTCKYCNTA